MPETYEATSNLTQASALEFFDHYKTLDDRVAEAVGKRKDYRKVIKGAGINLKAFDRARKDAEKSSEVREEEERAYLRLMKWLGKAIGHQAAMDLGPEPTDEDQEAVSEHQAQQVSRAGRLFGNSGKDRGSNPWPPGGYLAQVWDNGWVAGAEELAQRQLKSDAAAPSVGPKGRGRPMGSRNRPKNGSSGAHADA